MLTIAIIGAGLSGLTVANKLSGKANVTLFEKSAGVGGRMSTRRAAPYFFDHGAQFFKIKSNAFEEFLGPMLESNKIKIWNARFVIFKNREVVFKKKWNDDSPHYVGAPSMNVIAKHLGYGLNIRLNVQVKSIKKKKDKWYLRDHAGNVYGGYDWIISTVPAEQALSFLPLSFSFHDEVSLIKMKSCFSLMLGFENSFPLDFDAALVQGEDIGWISLNHSKPGRGGAFSLLVNSTSEWAGTHMNDGQEKSMAYLLAQAGEIIGHDLTRAHHKAMHRWRFASIAKQSSPTHFIDLDDRIGMCGDWFIQGDAEAAFTSGFEIALTLTKVLNESIEKK